MADDSSTLVELATVGSAVFTALAAGAAWLATRQGRQAIEAADRPLVEVQVLADATRERHLTLSIVNTGTGVARGVNFAVHALDRFAENVIGDGFMRPGERVHVLTNIGPLPTPSGRMQHDVDDLGVMVAYRDAQGFVHYRTHAGHEVVPRTALRRRPKFPDRTEIFRTFYPHIDFATSERVPHNVVQPNE